MILFLEVEKKFAEATAAVYAEALVSTEVPTDEAPAEAAGDAAPAAEAPAEGEAKVVEATAPPA